PNPQSGLGLSTGVLLGAPTGAQLFLSVHPKGLPSFRVAGGTMYYAHTWDVGAEIKVPFIPFLRLGAGYHSLKTSSAGTRYLADLINGELQSLEEGFAPLDPQQFQFSMSGIYVQGAIQIKVLRVEFGVTQHQLESLSH